MRSGSSPSLAVRTPSNSDRAVWMIFRNEVRAVAALDHPHVILVYDAKAKTVVSINAEGTAPKLLIASSGRGVPLLSTRAAAE